MPNWLRKSFVVLVTILTFGLVTPSQAFLYENTSQLKASRASDVENSENSAELAEEEDTNFDKDDFIRQMLIEAEVQSYEKFGAKIGPVIEDEFNDVILPNIEKAIQEVAVQFPEESLAQLKVTETPGGGLSEKIFHITNSKANEDVIRFHVRRDHPPQQGYWFNFHYHTHHDNFQAHHELGSIYWDKNTPPKWMS
ncbi:YpjP-like protein [Cytobacillus firmus]|uniref:YpjP-like protein n=2 Tax=Cytobacillus TaxID=2675230 RepID=A0A366JMJ7_CYTFI|nr:MULTISPECIES: YpjP family protein [Cytobacillus]RBP89097.1 YpjP-like protein [Cytobacillus firmus]TDX47050.1 YpjP-like protein [Cytobacillus oceanisediminis]